MPPPLRVVFCLDSFAIGGTELNAVRTAESLDPSRVTLSVVHLQTHGVLRERYDRLSIPMHHIPIPNLYSARTAMQGLRLARQLREWKAQVVHSHDIYCNIFAAPWARVRTSAAVMTSRRWLYEAPRPGLVGLNRLSARFAHRILTNSADGERVLVDAEKVPPGKVVALPNFLGENAFETAGAEEREAQRRAWGVPAGALAVGIVARLSPVKNHELLLRAIARLEARFHAVLIGDGPTRKSLEASATELGIAERVHFTGELVGSRNLHQFFDVSVLCSTSEGFPNSLIEGMAAARPVVATPVGGVADAVTDGQNGLVVPLGDAGALAEALRRLGDDAGLRERMGAAARVAARSKFHQDAVIERLTRLYEELAAKVHAGCP